MKEKSQLISVIIPVYKVESFLDQCIQSVVSQTYKDLEIVLIDDGSPDNCLSICEKWKKKDSRIRVIHQENGGLSKARNVGIEAATGQFIAFVDGDDWIAPELYERLIRAMETNGSDIAACTVRVVSEDGLPGKLLTTQENCVLNRIEAQAALLDETKLKHPVWYKLYKRSVIEGISFEKKKQHEDVFWSYQVIGNAESVILIDYEGYFYRQRQDSIMGKSYSLKHLDILEAHCIRYDYICNYFPELEKRARVVIQFNCIYHGQMALRYLSKSDQEIALTYLEEVKRKHLIKINELSGIKKTHMLWILVGRYSLRFVCRLKNILNVGM